MRNWNYTIEHALMNKSGIITNRTNSGNYKTKKQAYAVLKMKEKDPFLMKNYKMRVINWAPNKF